MRNSIKSILKEEIQYTYIKKVIQHLLKNVKGGARVPRFVDIINTYGLTEKDVEYLNQLEKDALDRLKGVLFNVTDYQDRVSIGGYDFKFVVRGLHGEEYRGADWLAINAGPTNFPQVNWTVEPTVLLRGGTVELIIARPEDGPEPLGDAIDNENYGWEIESEIGDIIRDIIYAEEPILPALGAYVSVDQSYE